MITLAKTDLVSDIIVAGTPLHRVPATRWAISTDEGTATVDIVASTAIVGAHGDRRGIAALLAHLTAMGLDLDVNEDDQHLEWMIGYGGGVWGVPAEVIIDHCKATMTPYQEG